MLWSTHSQASTTKRKMSGFEDLEDDIPEQVCAQGLLARRVSRQQGQKVLRIMLYVVLRLITGAGATCSMRMTTRTSILHGKPLRKTRTKMSLQMRMLGLHQQHQQQGEVGVICRWPGAT